MPSLRYLRVPVGGLNRDLAVVARLDFQSEREVSLRFVVAQTFPLRPVLEWDRGAVAGTKELILLPAKTRELLYVHSSCNASLFPPQPVSVRAAA